MSKPIAFSLIESPSHPNLSALLAELGYEERKFPSIRKAISALKKDRPNLVIADFIFAYANNYASNHISNLDSFLITFQKYPDYAPHLVFIATKAEAPYVETLVEHYDGICKHYSTLILPVTPEQARTALEGKPDSPA